MSLGLETGQSVGVGAAGPAQRQGGQDSLQSDGFQDSGPSPVKRAVGLSEL